GCFLSHSAVETTDGGTFATKGTDAPGAGPWCLRAESSGNSGTYGRVYDAADADWNKSVLAERLTEGGLAITREHCDCERAR
ncbi:MAG: hypothetical protein ACR2N7_04185, partial [Acidimicrobiia bacterium]